MTTALKLLPLLAGSVLALSPGDSVEPDALAKATFIRGEAPAAWEEGKLYVLDCWATWSPLSLRSIPHLDALHDKYHDQGLVVIGVNLQEDGRVKVEKFVVDQGDAMSYPVAFVGKGGEFETEWFKTGVSIPRTFVVKDGKILLTVRAPVLDESVIEGLLAGGDRQQQVLDRIQSVLDSEGRINQQLRAYTAAQKAGDAATMKSALDAIAAIDPAFPHFERMRIDIALTRKDWDAAAAGIRALKDDKAALVATALTVRRFDESAEPLSPALLDTLATVLAAGPAEDPSLKASLARVLWKLGKKEEARAAAQAAAAHPGNHPPVPYTAFAASFQSDHPQTLTQLIDALRAAATPAGPLRNPDRPLTPTR